MKKICFIFTTEMAVKAFMLSHLKALSQEYQLTVIVNTDNVAFLQEYDINATVLPIDIKRSIHPIADIKTLIHLIAIFRRKGFASVHSVTPKAGLLAMTAGFISRIPVRIHTFTGQVWATKSGLKRSLLKWVDCLYSALATHLIVDSPSQLDFLLSEKVVAQEKALVFGKGSISGVDLTKFKPNKGAGKLIRTQHHIPAEDTVFLFLGRLNKDKGVLDLVQAFINANLDSATLLLVGPDEQNIHKEIKALYQQQVTIKFVHYTNQAQDFMAAADVLCLPSYREGFGSVIIEAAACGVPALASRIYGITDAVVDEKTGLLHRPKDVDGITEKLITLHQDTTLRTQLGKQALERAKSDFNTTDITKAWHTFYHEVVSHSYDKTIT